jgi:formate hydrogenlyase subunit 3/multisubunit Na+/H+ antiporter MnhD subunit
MWVPKPVYELLPYAYGLAGLGLLLASYGARSSFWADLLLVLGIAAIVLGLMLALRRRDYRLKLSKYDPHSLDE